MTWTTEIPKVTGWYFWKPTKRASDPVQFAAAYVQVESDGSWDCWTDSTLIQSPRGGLWAGPIPLPD